MSWEAAGAIGEVIGALAVVISLVYLAMQIRQNAKMTKASIKHNLSSQSQVSSQAWALHAESVMRVVEDNNPSSADWFCARQLTQANFRSYENYLYQYDLGLLEDSEWEGIKSTMRKQLAVPATREWWNGAESEFSDQLVNLVKELTDDA